VKIELTNCSIDSIIIPANFTLFNLGLPTKVIVHLGFWKKELDVEIDVNESSNTIKLSKILFEDLTIPQDLEYEVTYSDRNLYIGPVIGFVPVASKNRLTPENLDIFKQYMKSYHQIKGLIILFSADSINFYRRTIEGYYYNPTSDSWAPGIFPLPSVIYRKTGFGKKTFDSLIDLLGNKLFNTYFFNKWELWNYMKPYDELSNYLPYTVKLTTLDSLDEMLGKYGNVYLKQIGGYKAKGIVKVHKSDLGYHFVYRLRREKVIKDRKQAEEFIKELNVNKNYLIQQSIEVVRFEDRPVDFRVILQKNGTGEFDCTGIIGRFGKTGSIATNFLLDGFSHNCVESLKLAFNLSEKEAFQKEQEIIRVCKLMCDKLNETVGHYGDLGIDVIVDKNYKIWILEINKLHDHKFPLYGLNDTQMYYRVLANPFLYAKYLSGF
jgi:hypothetical protein